MFENKTQEEAKELEKLYIKILMSNDLDYGYNIHKGGEYNQTEENRYGFGKSRRGSNNPFAHKIICDGIIYGCAEDCAKHFGVKYRTLQSWLQGWRPMPQKFIDMNLRFIDKEPTHKPSKLKKVICEGEIFRSIRSCAEFYNVNYTTMFYWLNNDAIPENFKLLGLEYHKD